MNPAIYLLLKFLVGGLVVLLVTLLANHIHPKYGGLVAIAPIITLLSIIFVRTETSVQATKSMILYSIYFLVPTAIFLVAMYFLIDKFSLWASLGISYGFWMIVSLLMIIFII